MPSTECPCCWPAAHTCPNAIPDAWLSPQARAATELRREAAAGDVAVLTLDRSGATRQDRNRGREIARSLWMRAADAHDTIGAARHAQECRERAAAPFLQPIPEV